MHVHDRLRNRRLLVVTGKGGVGKSALTAALGRSLAARGRRTLVLEVDPRENLHQLLDVPPSGGEVVEVAPRLYLQNLKPQDVVDWVVERKVPIKALVKRIKASPVYQRFTEGAPGLTELAILGHCLRLVDGRAKKAPPIDTVILDAPATGHGVYLLTAPRLVAEAIQDGPFARLARQAADFVADPDEADLVIATLAEEMPVQEAVELRQALVEKFGREPALLLVNAIYPPLPDDAGGQGADDGFLDLWRRRRQVNDRELARLATDWQGPHATLPLLPLDPGPELVATLHAHLDTALDALRDEVTR